MHVATAVQCDHEWLLSLLFFSAPWGWDSDPQPPYSLGQCDAWPNVLGLPKGKILGRSSFRQNSEETGQNQGEKSCFPLSSWANKPPGGKEALLSCPGRRLRYPEGIAFWLQRQICSSPSCVHVPHPTFPQHTESQIHQPRFSLECISAHVVRLWFCK